MPEKVRNIVTCYLIYTDWKPVAITTNKKHTEHVITKAEEKGIDAFYKEMTVPEERMQEIGINIFSRLEGMSEGEVNNILGIRNRLIRESFEVADDKNVDVSTAWVSVRKKYDAPIKTLSYEEFNRWTLDVANFVLIKR